MSDGVPIERFNSFINEVMTFLSIARDSELQRKTCHLLREFLAEVAEMKRDAVRERDEDEANLLLGFECVADCLLSEIAMWLLLKLERPEKAWDCLVSAQSAASAAARAHPGFAHLSQHNERLYVIEEIVFPPQIFVSSGFIAQRQVCSICGQDYGECDHLAGLPYMGEFCSIIPEGMSLDHVALVDNPADKRCRVRNFSVDGGRRNRMTWKIEPAEENDGEHGAEARLTEATIAVASGSDPTAEFW